MTGGAFSHETAMLILTRDRWCCFRCGKPVRAWERGQSWSLHHRRPRGAGGSTLAWVGMPANGITLCGHATTAGGCHQWAESNRPRARELGYLVPLNGIARPVDVPIMRQDGTWWRLSDTGGIEQIWGNEESVR